MLYHLLADLIVGLHILLGVFAIVGGFLALHRPRLIWLHVPVVLGSSFVELAAWRCPLTVLEKWLRIQAGGVAYSEGFGQRYIAPLLNLPSITYEMFACHAVFVLVLNLFIYWWIFRRSRGDLR